MMMDGFVVYRYIEVPKLSITENGVFFGKGVAEYLDNPEYAQILVNESTKEIAIRAASANDDWVFRFRKTDQAKNRYQIFHLNQIALMQKLKDMTGYDFKIHKYVITGKYLSDENAVVFDLMSATKA